MIWKFGLTSPFVSSTQAHKHNNNPTPQNKRVEQDITLLETMASQGVIEAMRELAQRLVEGDGVDKDEARGVSLLEDCVTHGDTVAMVMLAKCCAFGRAMERDAERAEALLFDAAKRGNDEALVLTKYISEWKEEHSVSLTGLRKCLLEELKRKTHDCVVSAERTKGDCAIERIAFVINVIPCKALNLRGLA